MRHTGASRHGRAVADFRRRGVAKVTRARAQEILALARHLPRADRALVEGVFAQGRSVKDVAEQTRRPPRSLQKSFRRLLAQIDDPAYLFLVRHGDRVPAPLRPAVRAVVFRRMSLRRAARASGRSLHRVRADLHAFTALAGLRA